AWRWGILESLIASVVAMLCFNFFFLPPIGTLTISDPQNWVALAAFMATAIVTSQLSGRARRRALDMATRQRDLERLYALSRAQLLWSGATSPGAAIAADIATIFGRSAVAPYHQRTGPVRPGGPADPAHLGGAPRARAPP